MITTQSGDVLSQAMLELGIGDGDGDGDGDGPAYDPVMDGLRKMVASLPDLTYITSRQIGQNT